MRDCAHCHQPVTEFAVNCPACGASLPADRGVASELMVRIRGLLVSDQKVEAIRALRDATGIGLAEATQFIEAEVTRLDSRTEASADAQFDQELLTLLQTGQKIEAIKQYRGRTNSGLKEAKDYVEGLAARHGIVAANKTGCFATVLAVGLVLVLSSAWAFGDEQPSVDSANAIKSPEGWLIHAITSSAQAAPTEIKVLLPDQVKEGKQFTVLYVLPVEARNEHRYGDGLAEVKRCNLHNKYNLICVAPTFAHLPWYADHPTDKSIQQESYFVKVVVPFIEQRYPVRQARDGRWLLGFSKSGWGAWSLLIRHPDLFGRAAAWDAPLDMQRYDLYGAGQVFGTQDHFESYRVLPAARTCKPLVDGPPRLVLTGYDNFRSQHETAHRLLEEWRVPHIYRDGPQRKHVWSSGWLEEAVELLAGLGDDAAR